MANNKESIESLINMGCVKSLIKYGILNIIHKHGKFKSYF